MAYDTILVDVVGSSHVVTLNRNERRNAISHRMMQELAAALESAATDPEARAVIITGGPAMFSSGEISRKPRNRPSGSATKPVSRGAM